MDTLLESRANWFIFDQFKMFNLRETWNKKNELVQQIKVFKKIKESPFDQIHRTKMLGSNINHR